LESDLLLCPGDLGHQASPVGIQYAWKELHSVGQLLNAKTVTATAGNHDIDSRYLGDDHAPEHILKGLVPQFPFSDDTLTDRYWGRAYAILDKEDYRLLVLNSSAYHGNTPVEKNHGRVDRQTLNEIEKDLKLRDRKEVNIFLCHHHPQQHSELELGEDDYMRHGQLLLNLLGSGHFGDWIVIHGHKHHPKITYAAGGASAPVVFSAGSLASKLFIPVQSVSRNQFYLISIEPERIETLGIAGTGRAWDWAHGTGWVPSGDDSGLPANFGFGAKLKAGAVTSQILPLVQAAPLDWNHLLVQLPIVRYILPTDLKLLEEHLREHGITITRDRSGPVQIGLAI
jgi:predicted phosphodiesterase